MKIVIEQQRNPINSEVTALISVVRPILTGLLYGIKEDIANELNGYNNIKLKMLPRLYRPGDGDVGISFEWAVHDAIRRHDPLIIERVVDACNMCRIPGERYTSLMFGLEKTGRINLIDNLDTVITNNSRVLTGTQAQPPLLKNHIKQLAAAFRRPETRTALPYSINGLWKADLFVGTTDEDRWVGTTLKINPQDLEGARGLRIGIVPASQGRDDRIRKDDQKNLVICPLPYDGSFMELFYTGWRIVKQFLYADARVPFEVALPNPPERQVTRELEMRREFNVLEIVQVLEPQSQTDLLENEIREINTTDHSQNSKCISFNDAIVAPVASLHFSR
jgi:hypothetical protein